MSLFGTSVLLVEDKADVALAIRTMLQDAQPRGWNIRYHFKVVGTLFEAKKVIKGGGYDIIILDLKLPDSEGIETFRACFKIAKAPIIVLSGTASFDTIRQLLQEGAAQAFEKHVVATSLELLPRAIVACIEHYRLGAKVVQLQETLLGELRNLITECANCHRWRDTATAEYIDLKDFLESHNIFLTGSICPECAKEKYGDLVE